MKRFKNVLYFADGEDRQTLAFKRALQLARRNRARLTIADVVADEDLPADLLRRLGIAGEHPQHTARVEALAPLVTAARDQGIKVRSLVLGGIAFVEIIRAVLRNGCDLVMKSARHSAGPTNRLFGTTDLHLLRKCPCPVWIDRAGAGQAPQHYASILAAVDPSQPNTAALNRLIMDLATLLAEREGAALHVVHAWRLPFESALLTGRARMPPGELAEALGFIQWRREEALGGLLTDYGLSLESPRVHLLKGHAAEVIAECADKVGAELIVMGTLGRAGVPGVFIGSTAEDVIQAAETPVLAVKPERFVSPVTLG
ncbi:MAG: universal stress protein [Thiohalocapsa sp.]|uniref:universal stress protein n=1 Tax=Thiohalocapsa sp. TaxID=2497641 RepID=UPI0025E1392A|nr:universal stress protein [Thiohalocapsa sp.]MCG6940405.1 universal stress protein [Thiohalocapsa sp.]